MIICVLFFFFFSSRRRHTRSLRDWSSDVCSSDLERLAAGMPAFGTCAGMILLATEVLDGRDDQCRFGAIDIAVRRNGFGRQVDSFETDLDVPTAGAAPLHA